MSAVQPSDAFDPGASVCGQCRGGGGVGTGVWLVADGLWMLQSLDHNHNINIRLFIQEMHQHTHTHISGNQQTALIIYTAFISRFVYLSFVPLCVSMWSLSLQTHTLQVIVFSVNFNGGPSG